MVAAEAVADDRGNIGLAVLERPHRGDSVPSSIALQRGNEAELASLATRTRSWPLHWFWIECGPEEIRIASSRLPTVPVYLVRETECARVDWDPARLYPYLSDALDAEAAAHYLCSFEQPYGPRTLLRDLIRLPAGYNATFRKARGWELTSPRSEPPSYPRDLKDGAEPTLTLRRMLDATLARSICNERHPLAVSFSGGLDSTLVAGVARKRGHPVSSFGLIMPGAEGQAQRARRASSIERLGLLDMAQPAEPRSLWNRGGHGRAAVVPWEELYHDPFDQLYAQMQARNLDVVLSGLGGDDLVMDYWSERDDAEAEIGRLSRPPAPPPFIRVDAGESQPRAARLHAEPRAFAQRSVLAAASNAAAQCLRHGLWPLHLLIAPEVVRYCHALPHTWRGRRRLIRDTLSELGLPREVTHPAQNESFDRWCEAAMRESELFRELVGGAPASELGLLDAELTRRSFADWCEGRAPQHWDLYFIAVVRIEETLHSVRRAHA